jgi:hypothetical protein
MRLKQGKSYSPGFHCFGFSVAIMRKTRQARRVEGDFPSPLVPPTFRAKPLIHSWSFFSAHWLLWREWPKQILLNKLNLKLLLV